MRRRIIFSVLLTLLTLVGGWYGWVQHARLLVVLRHIPVTPALDAQSAVLADSLAEAEARARSWRQTQEGLAGLSRLYHANGFYPEAVQCYEGLRQIDPRNPRWPHLHAILLADFGRLEEALPFREQAVVLAPDYLPSWLRLGDVLLKINRPADAARAYTGALERDSANPYALLGLARCDLASGDRTRARSRLQDAVARHPDFIGALSLLATVHEHLGERTIADTIRLDIGKRQFSEAPDAWFDELADDCFDAYRLSVAAAIASAANDRRRGLELIERAIALAPQIASYRRSAAQIMRADGNHENARRHLEEAVSRNPADSDAWLLLVDTLRKLGQDQAAGSALQKGLTHCPQSAGLHLAKAQQLAASQRLPEAIAEFRISAVLNPSDAAPLVEMADLCFATSQFEEGLAALHRALERQPGNPLALTSLTFYHITTANEAGALRHWQEVRRQPRTPTVMVENLRQAYRRQFNRELP
jgi:tetratricopeptide (TPR) repeat protein